MGPAGRTGAERSGRRWPLAPGYGRARAQPGIRAAPGTIRARDIRHRGARHREHQRHRGEVLVPARRPGAGARARGWPRGAGGAPFRRATQRRGRSAAPGAARPRGCGPRTGGGDVARRGRPARWTTGRSCWCSRPTPPRRTDRPGSRHASTATRPRRCSPRRSSAARRWCRSQWSAARRPPSSSAAATGSPEPCTSTRRCTSIGCRRRSPSPGASGWAPRCPTCPGPLRWRSRCSPRSSSPTGSAKTRTRPTSPAGPRRRWRARSTHSWTSGEGRCRYRRA